MKVTVERCWGSSRNPFWFRLTFPWRGRVIREGVSGEFWTRAMAGRALNLLEDAYHLPRRRVRFDHR